ncbi:PREDICTED: LOW QUALITY PROTEIN: cellulose synthase-like protein E1 [Tarenaya hassleriana]|uniref:LOW QUALITY PROTEIN: cellulose synthase-like protein E1 n=1 Tax=Tarenaya hassleriana TaxID=28532 RepID=UPI0008FD2F6D|nr:PREDICTED: LOW QUALITY PROTEIN: cellulose synthase-like protein E1 [Tarenaya hassleriana]
MLHCATMEREDDRFEPLYQDSRSTWRVMAYRVFAATVSGCICWIWFYRVSHIPEVGGNRTGLVRLVWFGMLGAELWFGMYWCLTQSLRWNPVRRQTFKDRLSRRYENDLPALDVFVCTADPEIEPPLMVVNTVLSVTALDYPLEKLAVYLSDDGYSELTFYALAEAADFAKHWVPFCKKFKVEPRSPAAYFSRKKTSDYRCDSEDAEVEKLYREMADRIETAEKLKRVPEDMQSKYKAGFSQWSLDATRRDHGTVLQILIDGRREVKGEDMEGNELPTLVYMSREKRPQYPHHFKAGAMNALIRVSSKITGGKIILNLDCDMYANSSQSAREALCVLLDERQGREIAFVQFPQCFGNITSNDLYGNRWQVGIDVEFPGLDGNGGPLYIGTGCFHRRDVICGRRYGDEESESVWQTGNHKKMGEISEEEIKNLASCTYDENSQWGKEMGLKYGCPVEDVITGLAIQCRGWKSVYLNPEKKAFVGVAPTTLSQTLVQHQRWSDGDFQILLSEYCPLLYGHRKIGLALQLGYCSYCLWAPTSIPTLYYSLVPSLCLLKGIPLFPEVSSLWFLPFGYVILATSAYSLAEYLWCGGTLHGWWNEQRMWLYKRTSSYVFGFIDTIRKLLRVSEPAFVVTSKVADVEQAERYNKETMEFGVESPMFTLLAVIGLVNLFCFVGSVKRVVVADDFQTMWLQALLTGILLVLNWPLYEGLFLRKDKGKVPTSETVKSVVLASLVCTCFAFL